MAGRNPIAKALRIMGKPKVIKDKREAIRTTLANREAGGGIDIA